MTRHNAQPRSTTANPSAIPTSDQHGIQTRFQTRCRPRMIRETDRDTVTLFPVRQGEVPGQGLDRADIVVSFDGDQPIDHQVASRRFVQMMQGLSDNVIGKGLGIIRLVGSPQEVQDGRHVLFGGSRTDGGFVGWDGKVAIAEKVDASTRMLLQFTEHVEAFDRVAWKLLGADDRDGSSVGMVRREGTARAENRRRTPGQVVVAAHGDGWWNEKGVRDG